MANEEIQSGAKAAAETQISLLDQAITATKQTAPARTAELMKTLTSEALSGTVSWNRNLTMTINQAIDKLDGLISSQLATIMQDNEVQKLEGSWRGLDYLIKNSSCNSGLKVRLLNASKKELSKDLAKASEFDQAVVFKKIYENEFGTPGGEPYGVLVGDYTISNHPDDIEFIKNMSHVSAAAFCPFVTSPSPELFGFSSWDELAKPRDLSKIFDSVEYAGWRSFRESDDSRFVSMAMPRVLARLPYGADTKPIEGFQYEELTNETDKGEVPHSRYTWMNAAYVMATKMSQAYTKYGWCTAIRGTEGGGKVENLPTHIFTSDDGDKDMKCPTEIAITDRREAELSNLGFLPLSHYKNTDYAVFFGGQSAQKPKVYDAPDATANAAISARLPYMMATSRFAHYLKVMARDKVGSFMEASDMEKWLNQWIKQYTNSNPNAGQELKAKFPLAEASIKVEEIPGAPGSYHAVAWMRPWLQFEELTTSMRMVAKLPSK